MKSGKAIVLLAITMLISSGILAQENNVREDDKKAQKVVESKDTLKIVVSATRTENTTKKVGSSVTVITAKEIEERQARYVLDVLRTVPALDILQSGGPGHATSVFIRGAKSEHTLVLVDGIEVNDPLSPARSADLSSLATDNVERIEIIRGPQSTLYGSDAIGGVINIITRRGAGEISGYASVEAGAFSSYRGEAGFSGGTSLVNYSGSVTHQQSDGISAAGESYGNEEKDGFKNTSISTRLGFTPDKNFSIESVFKYIDAEADLDNNAGAYGDDPNYVYDTKSLFFRTVAKTMMLENKLENRIGISYSDLERETDNPEDPDHVGSSSSSNYQGSIVKFDIQSNLFISEENTLTLGVETEEEKGNSVYSSTSAWGPYTDIFDEQAARTNSFYVQDQITVNEAFNASFGLRWDDHEMFGSEVTYRAAASYYIEDADLRLKGTFGSGFKAPSLYQLYSPYGDEGLEAEKSKGWDIGLEKYLMQDAVSLGITYFFNDFEDMIDYDLLTYSYTNVAEAQAKGIEMFLSARPCEKMNLVLSYTYTDTEDKITGLKLIRRPDHKFAANANYIFLEDGNLNLEFIYIGTREVNGFGWPAPRVELDSYYLVNARASWKLNANLQFFGRINNLFDEEYEEVIGYGTPGINVYAGVKSTF